MDKISTDGELVCGVPLPEPAECAVTEWLILKACGMECILVSEIKLALLNDFVITKAVKLFYYEGTHNNINRGIGA